MSDVVFDKKERERLAKACQILGATFGEFVHIATMHAVDEFEGGNLIGLRIRKEIAQCDRNVRPAALEDYKAGLQMALQIVEGKS